MSLVKNITNSINNISTLEIKTVVSNFNLGIKNGKISMTNQNLTDADAIVSKIDLFDGDIETIMSKNFVENEEYAKLREYHNMREQQGHQIIKNNIEVLKSLVGFFMDNKDKLGMSTSEIGGTTDAPPAE